ncbi:hypothetical protein HanRHA438_Chr16g0749391 [Helianthus annuus]|nr:hypothetical protein HanRHA438_Chr16g0749391 [Helianthus annuus]
MIKRNRLYVCVYITVYGSGETLKEGRPTTPRIKLCRGLVQRGLAPCTSIHPLLIELVIHSRARIPVKNPIKGDGTELLYQKPDHDTRYKQTY